MKTTENVIKLKENFTDIVIAEINFMGETTLEIDKNQVKSVLGYLKNACAYEVLMDLTAIDYLLPTKRTKIVYWLHNPSTYERIRVVAFIAREEMIATVTDLWEGADWYERELYDMFGVHFEGHPDLKRILMPDDWKGHPMLRDYALTEEAVEFKNDVRPKVPSEIIPYVKKNNRS